jgi:CBS domain containing-hemolysin-like protein
LENILLIFAAFLLVVLNGFFVAAEFSLVKLRQTRVRAIANTQGLRGRILGVVHHQLDAYLSACQLGITLASLGLGWIGEPAFARLLEPVFAYVGIAKPELIHGISFIFAFFVISYLHIVVGELAPKSLAIRRAETIGLWCAIPLYVFYWLMFPLIWVLNHSANWLLKVMGLGVNNGSDTKYSSDELKLILRTNGKGGKFTTAEWNVLAQTLDFGELKVAELMRPSNEIVGLYRTESLEENLETIYRNRFSRYPYFDEEQNVIGLIHLKDLFIAQQNSQPITNLEHYLRPVQFIPQSLSALELFRRFRTGSPHFAVIGKKGQPPQGFITLDNLLGMLVGEIRDEFRHSNHEWTVQEDGTLLGKGSLPIVTLEHMLGIDIAVQDDEDVDSVGGLVMEKLGEIPREGQKVEFDAFDVVVKRMKGPRIVLVKVYPKRPPSQDEEA